MRVAGQNSGRLDRVHGAVLPTRSPSCPPHGGVRGARGPRRACARLLTHIFLPALPDRPREAAITSLFIDKDTEARMTRPAPGSRSYDTFVGSQVRAWVGDLVTWFSTRHSCGSQIGITWKPFKTWQSPSSPFFGDSVWRLGCCQERPDDAAPQPGWRVCNPRPPYCPPGAPLPSPDPVPSPRLQPAVSGGPGLLLCPFSVAQQ